MLQQKTVDVSRFYESALANLLSRVGGAFACCNASLPSHLRRQVSAYSDDSARLCPDAVLSESFGCGDPVAFSDPRAGDTVVDIGCGAGVDLLIASARVGPSGMVIGIDAAPELVERARRNAAANGAATVVVRQGTMEDLPVDDAAADLIISNFAISLSADKLAVFAEMHRILRPGGRFAIADICADSVPSWLTGYQHLRAIGIASAIPEADYAAGLVQAGFSSVRVASRTNYTAEQITLFIEALCSDAAGRVLGGLLSPDRVARALEGHIRAVHLIGEKPATAVARQPD